MLFHQAFDGTPLAGACQAPSNPGKGAIMTAGLLARRPNVLWSQVHWADAVADLPRWAVASILLAIFNGHALSAETTRPPNIVILVADDLGYGELGCQGNHEIPTPNIDSL